MFRRSQGCPSGTARPTSINRLLPLCDINSLGLHWRRRSFRWGGVNSIGACIDHAGVAFCLLPGQSSRVFIGLFLLVVGVSSKLLLPDSNTMKRSSVALYGQKKMRVQLTHVGPAVHAYFSLACRLLYPLCRSNLNHLTLERIPRRGMEGKLTEQLTRRHLCPS